MDDKPHILVVSELDPSNPNDWFEIEHYDDCPTKKFGKDLGDNPYWYYTCLVGKVELDEGVERHFRHEDATDDGRALEPVSVGRHEIVGWFEHDERWGIFEHGLMLVEPQRDLSSCPYWRSLNGGPDGSCDRGCREEPSCVTDEPENGWPTQRKDT